MQTRISRVTRVFLWKCTRDGISVLEVIDAQR